MTRFEIIVEVNGVRKYLDTTDIETISLNFNIADITEPDKRNSSYSKTIKIPETRNNRAIFGDISDLTIDSTFNPNKKSRCWILVDTIVVFEGNLQLKKISMDWRYDYSFYECVIYADNDGFFKELGELYLTDIDFSELDHLWSKQTIMDSWVHSWNDGYFYPLIDYGYDFDLANINNPFFIGPSASFNPGIQVKQFYPATNVKYIVDKIFSDAGYTYDSTFFNTNEFKNLYIPYNRDGKYRKNPDDLSGRFTVGITASGLTLSCNNQYTFFQPLYTIGNIDNPIVTLIEDQIIPLTSEQSPYGDPNNVFDTNTYKYIAPATNIPEQRFSFNFDLEFLWVTGFDPNGPGNSALNFNQFGTYDYTGLQVKRSKNAAGQTITGGVKVSCNGSTSRIPFLTSSIANLERLNPETIRVAQDGNYLGFPTDFDSFTGYKRVKGTITTDIFGVDQLNYPLFPNEEVWVELSFKIKSSVLRYQLAKNVLNREPTRNELELSVFCLAFPVVDSPYSTNIGALSPGQPAIFTSCQESFYIFGADVARVNPNTFFYNNLEPVYSINEVIPYNQAIPLNVKQKDFISSLIKLFNLYIEPKKDNLKTLVIEPRDIFYQRANRIKDWTFKLNTNDSVDEQILAETQNKEIQLKYRDDKDFYNEDYTSKKNGDNYGIKTIEIDNDFTKGVKKIEPIFSPTPLIPMTNSNDVIIIPKIGKLNNGVFSNTDHNVRILTRYAVKEIKRWNYSSFYRYLTPSRWIGNTALTTTGGSNIPHNYVIGDIITITQNDGGVAYPSLTGIFVVVDVPDQYTIVIDLGSLIVPVVIVGGTTVTQDGLIPISHRNSYWTFQSERIGYVPYLGHLDDPNESRYDLNYGQSTTYFPYKSLTNNNLYNLYYKNLFDELISKDSKIISASFYLTAADIADFSFSDSIYIKNQYFKVNKIQNYDPTKEKTCKVELIKSGLNQVIITRIQDTDIITSPIEIPGDAIDIVERIQPFNISMSNPLNDIKSSNSLVTGLNNNVYSNESIVVGSNNRVSGIRNFVFGSGNTIDGAADGNIIFGNQNTVNGGTRASIVFGSNTEVSNPDTLQINQKFIVTSNFISAGRDEVLNMYFDNKPNNFVSGSRDMVREFGSQDPINYITAGRDQI